MVNTNLADGPKLAWGDGAVNLELCTPEGY